MKTLYIDCNMGAAGDMLCAALWELHPEKDEFLKRINSAGIPNVEIRAEESKKCGITGTHFSVLVHEHQHQHHQHEHHHAGFSDIEQLIGGLRIPEAVNKNALAVYRIIAEAESFVHNCEIEHIHFHEVGTADAVADVVCACMLLWELSPDKIIASPVHVGSGQVKCAHGILPVPAPATAHILKGVPIYGGSVDGELCTPTGAALLKYFVTEFGEMPVMTAEKIGYGMGTKDFERANCVRIFMGETEGSRDEVITLSCNLDDMTGEQIGYACGKLLEEGALDVYTVPAGMKKNRPGIILNCMCRSGERDKMLRLMFRHTSTIGIREQIFKRYVLDRAETKMETDYGTVRAKSAEGYGVKKIKAEYDELARLAEENGVSLFDIQN